MLIQQLVKWWNIKLLVKLTNKHCPIVFTTIITTSKSVLLSSFRYELKTFAKQITSQTQSHHKACTLNFIFNCFLRSFLFVVCLESKSILRIFILTTFHSIVFQSSLSNSQGDTNTKSPYKTQNLLSDKTSQLSHGFIIIN